MDPHAAHIDYRRSQFFAEADTRRLASTVSQSPRGTGHPTRRHARRALIAAMTAVLLAAGVVTAAGAPARGSSTGTGSGGVGIYHR